MKWTLGVIFGFAATALLSGCGADELVDPGDEITSPTTHTGPAGEATWGPGAGQHVLVGTVRIDTLTIQAGTEVCGQPGAILFVEDRLEVDGTADRPVLFTACDPEQGWGGIRVSPEFESGGSGRLSHVQIEHANIGIQGWDVEIVSARIRQTRGRALSGMIRVVQTTVDTACTGGGGCAAISTFRNSSSSLSDVVVRGSGGAGVAKGRRGGLALTNVTIEGSAGIGLDVGSHILHNDMNSLQVSGRLRITGNLYPASVATHDLATLLPNPAAHDSLLGNQRDTLLVGITWGSDLTVRPVLPWRVHDGITTGTGYASLNMTLEPGATLAGNASTRLQIDAGRQIEGTPSDPITFVGLALRPAGDGPDTTRLRHVRLAGGALLSTALPRLPPAAHPVVLENVELQDARVELTSAGARIDGLVFNDAGEAVIGDTVPILRLAGPGSEARNIVIQGAPGVGIELDGDEILLSRCRATGSVDDGILVHAGAGIRIRDCNIVANSGFGVNNLGEDVVDASGNWWGDAGGPDGPDGDGVSGPVESAPWLTEPAPAPGQAP